MPVIDGVTYISSTRMPTHGEKSSPYLILRLLLGTLKLEINNKSFRQSKNYLPLQSTQQSKTNSQAVDEFLTQFGIPTSAAFVRNTLSDNRPFYRDLLAEYAQYFFQTEKSNHVSAFVFLYRILERISYSFPLLYCSVATEYSATYDLLKKLFAEAGGDLSFFKKFLQETKFVDKLLLDTTYDIAFVSQNGYAQNYYKAVTKIYNDFAFQDKNQLAVKIKLRNMSEFIVTLRNRFLHARTGDGQANILVSQIKNPDEFFSHMNPLFVSFLAYITLQILGKKYA